MAAAEGGAEMSLIAVTIPLVCPHCGVDRLFGPETIRGPGDLVTTYYDCPRCHSIVVEEDGVLVARAGAW